MEHHDLWQTKVRGRVKHQLNGILLGKILGGISLRDVKIQTQKNNQKAEILHIWKIQVYIHIYETYS